MPLIKDFSQFLEEQVAKNPKGQKLFRMLEPAPLALKQRGQTCKLNALSMVLNWLHQPANKIKPWPVLKNKSSADANERSDYSLRKLAKKYNSQVGEIYSIKTLAAIAHDCGYADTAVIDVDDKNYVNTVINLINENKAPIVFFDVNFDYEPDNLQSAREHAAVTIGYFRHKTEGKMCFILAQWGNYFWEKADAIAESANQLSTCREPETFYKYGNIWYEQAALMKKNPELFVQPADKTRKALPLPETDGGLKSKIFVVNKPSNSLLKMTDFESSNDLLRKRW